MRGRKRESSEEGKGSPLRGRKRESSERRATGVLFERRWTALGGGGRGVIQEYFQSVIAC